MSIPTNSATEGTTMFGWWRKKSPEFAAKQQAVDQLQGAIDTMVRFLQSSPDADLPEIRSHLEQSGIPPGMALDVVSFTPIAFTRFLYRDHDIRFPSNFFVIDIDGGIESEGVMDLHPVYIAARGYCTRHEADGSIDVEHVAAYSAGYKLIQDAINRGDEPEYLMFGPPIIPGYLPADESTE